MKLEYFGGAFRYTDEWFPPDLSKVRLLLACLLV